MKRLFGLTIVAVTALSAAAMAATPERVRGTVASVTADSVFYATSRHSDGDIWIIGNRLEGDVLHRPVNKSVSDIAGGPRRSTSSSTP